MSTHNNDVHTERTALFHAAAVLSEYARHIHCSSINIAKDWLRQWSGLIETNTRDSATTHYFDVS